MTGRTVSTKTSPKLSFRARSTIVSCSEQEVRHIHWLQDCQHLDRIYVYITKIIQSARGNLVDATSQMLNSAELKFLPWVLGIITLVVTTSSPSVPEINSILNKIGISWIDSNNCSFLNNSVTKASNTKLK